uniref:Transmembrane protein 126A n=1 Tax=Saimiri boliviensis boliviensis TaxID=39432 RepID=A0A2K6UFG7_SAIBB
MENYESINNQEDIFEILNRKINQLPEAERNLLENGSVYVGLNAALCGLIGNSLFRLSALPMAVIPFFTTQVTYRGFVTIPLTTELIYFLGDLICETCTATRSGLVGLLVGGLYPVFLALPINGTLLPNKENILSYWLRVSKPVFRKMFFPILLQTVFSAYLGSKQYKLFIKALHLPEPGQEIH